MRKTLPIAIATLVFAVTMLAAGCSAPAPDDNAGSSSSSATSSEASAAKEPGKDIEDVSTFQLVEMEDVVLEIPRSWECETGDNFATVADGSIVVSYSNVVDQRAEDALATWANGSEPQEIVVNGINYKGVEFDDGFFVATNSGDTGSIQVSGTGAGLDDVDPFLTIIQYKHR